MRYLCLTFDVEPDIARIGGGFRGIEKGIPALLEIFDKVEEKTGKKIAATWFITHDYWCKVDKLYSEIVKKLNQRDDEIGLHVHWGKKNRYFYNQEFQRELLAEGTYALRDKGYAVTSFRGGGLHLDEFTLKILEELGYLVDSSILPGLKIANPETNFCVNHHHCIMQEPFYINYTNHCMPGESNIIECPLTTTRFFSIAFPPYRIEGVPFRLQIRRENGRQTGLAHSKDTPEESLRLMRQILSRKLKNQPQIIVLTFHPWEFFEGNENASSMNDIPLHYLNNIKKWLVELARLENIKFSTLEKACEIWREENKKQPVNQRWLITVSTHDIRFVGSALRAYIKRHRR